MDRVLITPQPSAVIHVSHGNGLVRLAVVLERLALADGVQREQRRQGRVVADFHVAGRTLPRLDAVEELAPVGDFNNWDKNAAPLTGASMLTHRKAQ